MTKTEEIANEFVKKFPVLFTEEADWWASEINLMLISYFEHIREEAAKITKEAGMLHVALAKGSPHRTHERIANSLFELEQSIQRMPVP